jgi:hypothetical protein
MGYVCLAIIFLEVLYITYEALRTKPVIEGRYGTPTIEKRYTATYKDIMVTGSAPTPEHAVALLDEAIDEYRNDNVYVIGQGKFGYVEIYPGEDNIWTARYTDWDFPVLSTELDKIVDRLDFYREALDEHR